MTTNVILSEAKNLFYQDEEKTIFLDTLKAIGVIQCLNRIDWR